MPYSTPADVRALAATELTDTQIAALIEASDAEIDRRVGTQTSTDPLVRKLSSLLTARTIKASQPGLSAVGEYREEEGRGWGDEIKNAFRALATVAVERSHHHRRHSHWRG